MAPSSSCPRAPSSPRSGPPPTSSSSPPAPRVPNGATPSTAWPRPSGAFVRERGPHTAQEQCADSSKAYPSPKTAICMPRPRYPWRRAITKKAQARTPGCSLPPRFDGPPRGQRAPIGWGGGSDGWPGARLTVPHFEGGQRRDWGRWRQHGGHGAKVRAPAVLVHLAPDVSPQKTVEELHVAVGRGLEGGLNGGDELGREVGADRRADELRARRRASRRRRSSTAGRRPSSNGCRR